jgi:DNA segregation ATPase FtsK/SpoIIIE, S-DNA-T family
VKMSMSTFSGQQIAQVDNPDPFAIPVWRSRVYHTPGWLITIVQLWRLLAAVVGFIVRHPVIDLAALALAGSFYAMGWPGPVILVLVIVAALAGWRWRSPGSFARFITDPARGKWRRWHYQRHWAAVMTIGRLAPAYQGRILLPVLGKVTSTRYVDRVLTGIVSGQSAEDFARRAANLAHGFAAHTCRVRTGRPGLLVLEFVRRDALAAIITALPIPAHCDLRALMVGRREDGSPWTIRLHGTHLLIAGATGAGKGSVIWGLIRALLPPCAQASCASWPPTRRSWNWPTAGPSSTPTVNTPPTRRRSRPCSKPPPPTCKPAPPGSPGASATTPRQSSIRS